MECRENCKPRTFLLLMQLPIDKKDLDTIISALSLGGDTRLYFLLKNIRDSNNLEREKFDVAECDI